MGGWEESIVWDVEGGWNSSGTSEGGSEDGQDDEDIGRRDKERGELLRSVLFSPACRTLEVLRLGEMVKVTEHETIGLARGGRARGQR